MLYDFLFGIIGILALTVYCLPGAFMVPQIAYWFMTPYATKILEDSGSDRFRDAGVDIYQAEVNVIWKRWSTRQ